jgi:hypothetical protein
VARAGLLDFVNEEDGATTLAWLEVVAIVRVVVPVVLLPVNVTEDGWKLQVAPSGSPAQEN